MKKGMYISIIFTLLFYCFWGTTVFAAITLYDDFSGPYLDSKKWLNHDLVRKIDGGELLLKIGNDSGTGFFRNDIGFQNPDAINSIECKITVVDISLK